MPAPEKLRCELLNEPLGIDAERPFLSWIYPSAEKNLKLDRFHVLVASAPELLAKNQGDLWDSGVVSVRDGNSAHYAGKALKAFQRCYWKVRVGVAGADLSPWSKPGFFRIGPRTEEDWNGAAWIGGDGAAAPTAANGFHAQPSSKADDEKYIRMTFPAAVDIDKIILYPACPVDVKPETPGFGFPKRFKLEVADKRSFADASAVADKTGADVPNPGSQPQEFPVGRKARYVKLTATKHYEHKGALPFCFALAEIEVYSKGKNIAAQARITPSDSVEGWGWSETALTDGAAPAIAGMPESAFWSAPMMRTVLDLDTVPKSAFLSVASLGYHEVFVNGKKVGKQVLAPNLSTLNQRVLYDTYDIAPLLKPGKNAVAIQAGVGWSRFATFGAEHKPLLKVHLDCDGKTALVSNETWKTAAGATALLGAWTFRNMGGEYIDGRREQTAWTTPEFDASGWANATVRRPGLKISADNAEPNVPDEKITPVGITPADEGGYLIDMGRNFTGFVELRLKGTPGETVTLSFSENEGEKTTYALESKYTFGPSGEGTFRNQFNYSCGRWITVSKEAKKPELSDITAHVVHNDYERIGTFECSDPLLNDIYRLACRTFESLSLGGYHVDCNNRERFGYGAEGHIGIYVGANNYGYGAVMKKWLRDWRDTQRRDGGLPYSAPTYEG